MGKVVYFLSMKASCYMKCWLELCLQDGFEWINQISSSLLVLIGTLGLNDYFSFCKSDATECEESHA